MEGSTDEWILGDEKDPKKGTGSGESLVNLNQMENGEVKKKL